MSDVVLHALGPRFIQREIEALSSDEDKKTCMSILKSQVALAQQLETIDAIDAKINQIKNKCEEYQNKERAAPPHSLGERAFFVLTGVGSILLCPISWIGGTFVAAVTYVALAWAPTLAADVSGKIAKGFYMGPVNLVNASFKEAIDTKQHWQHKVQKTEAELASLQDRRLKVVTSIESTKNETKEKISKLAKLPLHLSSFSNILSEEVAALSGTTKFSANSIQNRYGYNQQEKQLSLEMFDKMVNAMKVLEKDLPESVLVRGKNNKVDYILTLDKFMEISREDFLPLFVKYRDRKEIPQHLWKNLPFTLQIAKEYGYDGENKGKALTYLKTLFETVIQLSEKEIFPPGVRALDEGRRINCLKTLENFKNMPLEEFLRFQIRKVYEPRPPINVGNLWNFYYANASEANIEIAQHYGYTGKTKKEATQYLKGLAYEIATYFPNNAAANSEKNMVSPLSQIDAFLEMPTQEFLNHYLERWVSKPERLDRLYIIRNLQKEPTGEKRVKMFQRIFSLKLSMEERIAFMKYSETDFNSEYGLMLLEYALKQKDDVELVLKQGIDLRNTHRDAAIEFIKRYPYHAGILRNYMS